MRCGRLAAGTLALALAIGCGAQEPAPASPPASDAGAWQPAPEQVVEAKRLGFPVSIRNAWGMRFVLVPPGEFLMGSPQGEGGRGADETEHEVRLVTAFYLQTTEVTNAQWRRFRPDHRSGQTTEGRSLDADEQPVVRVSHEDALAFVAWLSREDAQWTYRLPTEAEWEYACRAGEASAHAPEAMGHARPAAPRAVGQGRPNAWGLYDLCGNVAEWCFDRYGRYPDWLQDNPQGATEGEDRVVRGGAFTDPPRACRAAARERHAPRHASERIGLRVVAKVGYGDASRGAHPCRFVTFDPRAGGALRPGYGVRMISMIDRLTDRQIGLPDPRWRTLADTTPLALRLVPQRYYAYAFRVVEGREIRGDQVKFEVPGDGPEVRLPVPPEDQR